MTKTTWGTSARSQGEIRAGDSFSTRTFHVGHLVLWYNVLSVGIAYTLYVHFKNPLFFVAAALGVLMSITLYVDFSSICCTRKKKLPIQEKVAESLASKNSTDLSTMPPSVVTSTYNGSQDRLPLWDDKEFVCKDRSASSSVYWMPVGMDNRSVIDTPRASSMTPRSSCPSLATPRGSWIRDRVWDRENMSQLVDALTLHRYRDRATPSIYLYNLERAPSPKMGTG
jgi:hypothetical protein